MIRQHLSNWKQMISIWLLVGRRQPKSILSCCPLCWFCHFLVLLYFISYLNTFSWGMHSPCQPIYQHSLLSCIQLTFLVPFLALLLLLSLWPFLYLICDYFVQSSNRETLSFIFRRSNMRIFKWKCLTLIYFWFCPIFLFCCISM